MKNWIIRIKEVFSKKTLIKLAIVAACLLIVLVLQVYRTSRVRQLYDQNAASRWTPKGGSAQVTVFFKQDALVTGDRVRELLYNLDTALTEASIEEDADEAVSINHCFSVTGTVTITAGTRAVTFPAIGCGGDFFTFHPVQLVAGSFFSEDMLMQDAVLLDETAAWQLFGGNNIAGQTVMIGEVPHVIAGVVRNEAGRIAEASGLDGSMVYLSFDSMSRYGNVPVSMPDAGTDGGTALAPMQTLELLMPEPVRGFSVQLVREKLGVPADSMRVIDNGRRFSNMALYQVLTSFGTRSMQPAQTTYPYWENAARGWEDILALCFLFQILFLAAAVILLTEMIVNGYRHKKWTAAGLYEAGKIALYDLQARRKAHKEKWRYF